MKTISLSGSLRESVGKRDSKDLRNAKRVPCVIYGGEEQVHFSLEEADFRKILNSSESFLVEIEISGKKYKSILQDVQFHPVSDRILHSDFLEVKEGKQVKVSVPVRLTGVAPGVLRGGKVITRMRKLIVKGLIEHLPEYVDVEISKLEIGDFVKVGDLVLEGIEFLDRKNETIVGVKTVRGVIEETKEEEEATEEGGEAKE
ncbi:MAG: 50S ribosomal protein L25/general stress protein Ctc [Bacteroidetes bacterium]|nr:50S ribosomal protein L25/general stress protein Ctc [Bacteroidota bacterium]MBU1718483.1 50S ribosomal protein L25/general stress protein Ctc [Bacteroidota bacterium]